jgi:hypothetical protein
MAADFQPNWEYCLTIDICRTVKKPEPPKPIIWNVYEIASKGVWLGEVAAR